MIDIKIDPQSAVPPFEQLREAVIARIASGELAPGSKLPPVRSLAAELGLAANTVARSYKELEAAGFVQTQGRNGTIVAPSLDDADRHRRALQLTSEYLMTMTAIGVPRGEIDEYLDRVGRRCADHATNVDQPDSRAAGRGDTAPPLPMILRRRPGVFR